MRLLPALSGADGIDLIAAASSLSGAFWQMSTPGPEIAVLYRSDPLLSHALVDVQTRVQRLLTALIRGLLRWRAAQGAGWDVSQPSVDQPPATVSAHAAYGSEPLAKAFGIRIVAAGERSPASFT